MNELHRLSALRALPAIDIHAHYGCWNLPQPQLQSAQAEMPGELSLLLRKKESAGLPVRLGGLAAASAVKFLTLYLTTGQAPHGSTHRLRNQAPDPSLQYCLLVLQGSQGS